MHYSPNPAHVECIRYKPSGKYYDAFAIDMADVYNDTDIHEAVKKSICRYFYGELGMVEDLFSRWIFSVSEPYHKNSYPILLVPEHMIKANRDKEAAFGN